MSLVNPGPANRISVVYQNVQGLIPFSNLTDNCPNLDVTKITELQFNVSVNKPDVIILNETWLKSSILDSEIFDLEAYKVFRLDRSQKTHPPDPHDPKKFRKYGGGVLIAIKAQLVVQTNYIELKSKSEFLAVEFKLNDSTKIIIATCYRVGTLGYTSLNEISKSIKTIIRKRGVREFVLVGDFNLTKIDWSDQSSRSSLEQEFLNMFAENSLLQCIYVPTHRQGNTLDLLFTLSSRFVEGVTVHNEDLLCKSDHYQITFDLNLKLKRSKTVKRKCYNFKKADWARLNAEFTKIDWQSTLECLHPDTAWNSFVTILKYRMVRHIPTITLKSESQPIWYDFECHRKCKEKERYHKKYKRTGSLHDGLKFTTARKEFKKLVNQKMRENLYDYEDTNLLSKKFWTYVKRTTKSNRIPEIVCRGSSISSDTKTKADMFNKFFYDQFSEPSIYNTDITFESDNDFDIDFSPSRVRALLAAINTNKACGPDEIPGMVLKMCSDSVALPLSIIYKLVYNTGSLPLEWKLSNIVPIFKKGDSKEVSNYRPISLLCIASKIMERIIHEEITIKVMPLIDKRQHGFLPNRSCSTNLVQLTDDVAQSLHKNIGTDIIYFDFAKAFDTVSHDIILRKLKQKFNIDGRLLKFLQDYLAHRRQKVILDNVSSNILNVNSGVPQGSILGPLLFIIFINDIYDCIDPNTKISQYADDTKIWRQILSEHDCEILQTDVNK